MNQPSLDFTTKENTQEGVVLALLRSKTTVTNRDFQAAGISHIARNRVSALREKGYVIAQRGVGQGDDWLDNAYRIIWYPGEVQDQAVEAKFRTEGWWIRPEEWRKKKIKNGGTL